MRIQKLNPMTYVRKCSAIYSKRRLTIVKKIRHKFMSNLQNVKTSWHIHPRSGVFSISIVSWQNFNMCGGAGATLLRRVAACRICKCHRTPIHTFSGILWARPNEDTEKSEFYKRWGGSCQIYKKLHLDSAAHQPYLLTPIPFFAPFLERTAPIKLL